jgi:benzoyl-CoA reductase/2-hydroxyglutaryl-CoA dehydratase subunit BcrC/BadD/HgdB
MAMASSYFCDMGSKADDLLAELYGTPIYYIDGIMDSAWGEFPEHLPERVEFLGTQFNQLFDMVKEVVGIEVSTEAWKEAAGTVTQYLRNLARLYELMQADPLPVSFAEIELASVMTAACTGRGIPAASKAVENLIQEMEKRIEDGIGAVEKGAPRVMVFAGNFSDASVTRMIENAGLAISTAMLDVYVPSPTPKTAYPTLGEIIAESEMRMGIGLFHSSYGTVKRTEMVVNQLKSLDGVIFNYQFNCRPSALLSHSLKKWVAENTHIPVLALEGDLYDSRSYSASAMRTRVETFAEMLKDRKAAN